MEEEKGGGKSATFTGLMSGKTTEQFQGKSSALLLPRATAAGDCSGGDSIGVQLRREGKGVVLWIFDISLTQYIGKYHKN